MKHIFFVLSIFSGLLFLAGCTAEQVKSLQAVPKAFGNINQINVIADNDLWEGPVGDTFRYYFESPYLLLPQPEPIFDLRHFTPGALETNPLRKELRTYFFLANLNDENSPTTQVLTKDIGSENVRRSKEDNNFNVTLGRDKWAQGQLLIYSFAYSEDALIGNIKKNFPSVMKRIYLADKNQVEGSVYAAGFDYTLMKEIKNDLGVEIKLPKDYFVATKDDKTIWLRKETKELSSNLLIHKLKYTHQSQLTKAGLKQIRDSLGRAYITTEISGAYMRINDIDLPLLTENIELNGNFAIEARGIWDIVNDYMGGPFLSYLIHKSNSDQLVLVDGFVYAPGQEKRDYMQQIELILSSAKF